MFSSVELLTKLNADNVGKALTLVDIMPCSPAQFRELAAGRLTLGEIDTLYALAQQAQKENTILESRVLSRANPQLTSLAQLDVTPLQEERGYAETFPSRANSFVAPGSVSSMFSPAAYLTELYREAKPLHPQTSQYSLNNRRPDLGQLLLSQSNMDTEVSTLSLSNDILMSAIAGHQSWSNDKVMEALSTYRLSGETPYHRPYAAIRESILQRDPHLTALAHSPYFSAHLSPLLLMALELDVPPELLTILTEDITDENVDSLFEENFGSVSIDYLSSVSNLAHYYDLSTNEVVTLISALASSRVYQKNQLNSVVINRQGTVSYFNITIESTGDQLHYAYLIPLMGGLFEYDFSVTSTNSSQTTLVICNGLYGDIYFDQENFVPIEEENTQVCFTIPDDHLSQQPLPINVQRWTPGGGYNNTQSHYKIYIDSKAAVLLLNKFIRLYKASGFTLPEMERVALDIGDVATFSDIWLYRTAYAKYLAQQYAVSLEAALVLADADIGTQSTDVLPSQFDLLFNTPQLNGQTFALGGDAIVVNPAKLVPADSFRRAVLKRAFQADDAGLWLMHQIGNRTVTDSVANTLANLSDLYRIALLAQAHALTVDELNTLLLLSPYRDTKLYGIDEVTLKEITQYLFFATEWLAEQKWSVSQLFVMVTSTYSTTWTPALDDLQQTLLNGLGDQPDLTGDALVTAMAPFIASSLHLNISNLAESCLLWANQINPAGQTVDSFWVLIQKAGPTPAERNNIIAFAQTLAQLALIVNNTAISEQELVLLVDNPSLLASGMTTLGLSVDILQQLTLFHRWINGAGAYVNDALAALSTGTLDAALLANTLQKDVTQVTQAMTHAAPGVTKLAHWDAVFTVIQWLDVAGVLGITPDGIAELITLTYDSTTSYATWSGLGDMMLGVLAAQDSEAVHGVLDAGLSAALSNYYMREVSPVELNSRDDLYSYLLIDNQVSAQVKTSRLAEAIASVQLYVYRTLNGQESGADTAVSTRQFFVDWDTYNARYSTWAGVSQLVYYPENYVDPTMRVGQTAMMDNMLQQISQSTLSSDVVELGLFDYLTAFDEIANLDVISGYHDNVDINQGLSYFVSCSQTEPKKFYWRSVDHSKSVQGAFAANAWSEWREITCAITLWNMTIRPVLLNSRLFISWVERVEQINSDGTTTSFVYTLKLSRMNYNDEWSSPFSYDVTSMIRGISEKTNELGMFCAEYQGDGSLIVYFYKKEKTYTSSGPANAIGLYIYTDMSRQDVDMNNTSEKDRFDDIKRRTYFTLDTLSEARVNNIYSDRFYIDIQIKGEETNNDYDLISYFSNITCTGNILGEVTLDLAPSFKLSYADKISLSSNERDVFNVFLNNETPYEIFTYTSHDHPETNAFLITYNGDYLVLNFKAYISYKVNEVSINFSDTTPKIRIPLQGPYNSNGNIGYYRSSPSSKAIHKNLLDKINVISLDYNDGNGVGSYAMFFNTVNTQSVAIFNPDDIVFSITTESMPLLEISAKDESINLPLFNSKASMVFSYSSMAFDLTSDFSGKQSVNIPCTFSVSNARNIKAKTDLDLI
ncbi:TPA: neuraminidase-like domain-containing protein, partial [Serratia marcescens]